MHNQLESSACSCANFTDVFEVVRLQHLKLFSVNIQIIHTVTVKRTQ